MYKRHDKEFVVDMYLACEKIMRYVKGLTYEEFKRDSKTIDAVVRNIEILGEAAKNISQDFRGRWPDIEWSEIARTRDKLIHFYFGVDKEVIWDIINKDIPRLFDRLRYIIEQEGWKEEIED